MQGGGRECESTGTGPGDEQCCQTYLWTIFICTLLCIFVRCKEEEESVSLLGRVQVLSIVVKHIYGRFLSVLCIFVRCKEEEESVSLLGLVQVLSSVVKHINGRFLSLLGIFVRCKEEEESVSLLGRVQVLSSVDELMEGREEQQQEPLSSLVLYLYFHFIDSTVPIYKSFTCTVMKKAGIATSASSLVTILFVPLSYIGTQL
jgi:hypothetical protein